MKSYISSKENKTVLVLFFVVILVTLFSLSTLSHHLIFNNSNNRNIRKVPTFYWALNSSSDFELNFYDITGDGVPEVITSNGFDGIFVYDLMAKKTVAEIYLDNATHIEIIGINHYISNSTEILLFATLRNRTHMFYTIDLLAMKVVWGYSFDSNESIIPPILSKNVYYCNIPNKTLVFAGSHWAYRTTEFYVASIDIESKKKIWSVSIPGQILASTIVNATDAGSTLNCGKYILLWVHTNYTISLNGPVDSYMLYCIDLKTGTLRWTKGPFNYVEGRTITSYLSIKLLNEVKADFDHDSVNDAVLIDTDFIYIISGSDGHFIAHIPFHNANQIIIDDFDNNGLLEAVVMSVTGQLATFSLPTGVKLWEMNLHLNKLNWTGRIDVFSEKNNVKDILFTNNDTFALIAPVTGAVIFNKSILNVLPTLNSTNNNVHTCCRNFPDVLMYTWAYPIAADLSGDSRNELVLTVFPVHLSFRCGNSFANDLKRDTHGDAYSIMSENINEQFCKILVLDSRTGDVIEFMDLQQQLGFNYLYTLKTYSIVTTESIFLIIQAQTLISGIIKPITLVIKFSAE